VIRILEGADSSSIVLPLNPIVRLLNHGVEMPMNPLWQLTLTRFREFYREPSTIFWVYGFPLILAFTLGMAFREKPVPPSIIDVQDDPDHPGECEKLVKELEKGSRLVVQHHDEATCKKRLRTSKSDLIIVPRVGRNPDYEYVYDETRSECVLAKNAAEGVLLRANSGLPEATEQLVVEPGGRYIDFLIPGLLGINLLGGGLFGVGFVTADMRVRKLLKRFQATPMRRSDFLLSLMLSRLVFTLIEITLLLGFAYLVFDIRIRGNEPALLILIAVGGISFSGLGLLVGCRARTLETVSGLVNAAMLPMYVFSGVFFSSSRFPDAIQPIIQILPLTALNDGLRAIMNDAAGFEALPYPLVILAVWGGISFVLAVRFFRWQ
jgi:ABC-2 type transport system permease protein